MTRAFAEQGSLVAFVDIADDSSTRLADLLLHETGAKPLFLRCDLRDIAGLQKSIQEAAARLGDIAVLVNNAGNDDRHAVGGVTPAYWDDRIAVNQRHMFFAAQEVFPIMKRRGGGSIINMSSIIWKIKQTDAPIYSMSKASIHGLTRAIAREFGLAGIRVNTILPGAVWTERQKQMWLNPQMVHDVMAGQCLQARIAPEDVARLALFLASDASRMCTAQEFTVDAGWS
jgi:NAD(P)-dependent dehydrogenase (short-subunit alcohol dehydrogenase family)